MSDRLTAEMRECVEKLRDLHAASRREVERHNWEIRDLDKKQEHTLTRLSALVSTLEYDKC